MEQNLDLIKLYREERIREKMKNDKLPTEEYDRYPIHYKDRHLYTFRAKYRFQYHFAEIFNRITAREQNKPSHSEIEQIKSRLNNDYSQKSIYKNTNYNQRKHLIHIWHVLNNKSLPYDDDYLDYVRRVIFYYFNIYYREVGLRNRAIKYRLVIDVICEREKFDDIRDRLFFRDNKRHREIVNQVLNNKHNNN